MTRVVTKGTPMPPSTSISTSTTTTSMDKSQLEKVTVLSQPSPPQQQQQQQQQQQRLNQPKPWYYHITLDVIIRVLSRSIFHPAITLIAYLCVAAMHKHRTKVAYYMLYWAAFLACIELVIFVNHRVTHGWARKTNWKDEVVVITGGGSGLGRVLAEMLMISKGVRVAILDVKEPDAEAKEWLEGRGGFMWEVCDVSDLEQVKRAAENVVEELGKPTILINNAATPVHGLPLVPTLDTNEQSTTATITPAQAVKTFNVNTLSHFNTLTTFLPSLLSSKSGSHIVTISSILSHLAPSNLADYSASKAALSSIHHTLTHELSAHPSPVVRQRTKTILVEPGQMDTQLFANITSVPWYAHFFGPVLEAKDVAREIVNMLERGEGGTLRAPFYCKFMPLYVGLPGVLQIVVRWFAGIDRAIVPPAAVVAAADAKKE